MEGLPDWLVASSARAAADRELPGKHVITLARSSVEPFLQFSARRDLREKAFAAWTARGEHPGPTDNRPIAGEIVALRAERARLLGFESFADFRLADTMAKTPGAARALLEKVWTPALARAAEEEAALQHIVAEEGGNFKIAPWDWRYYAEKRRRRLFDVDEDAIKPYLTLDRMIEAAFFAAGRLFGLSFVERFDIPLYHPDVRSWTALSRDGAPTALFFGDYFARPSKRSGAWSSGFRKQEKLDGAVLPIVVNVLNLAKPPEGEPPLLSFEEARTLFHEFGHALHAMLSNVTYPLISGTSVAPDFVEFPSQVYERWLERPEMLRRFALHRETGEPMPDELLDKLLAAERFNQGFRDGRIRRVRLRRPRSARRAGAGKRRRRRLREAGVRKAEHAASDRDAAPHAAFPAHLQRRRLRFRLLQLSLVRGSRRRRLRGLRGKGRHLRSRPRRKAARLRLFRRQSPRSGDGLREIPRTSAGARGAHAQARISREANQMGAGDLRPRRAQKASGESHLEFFGRLVRILRY